MDDGNGQSSSQNSDSATQHDYAANMIMAKCLELEE